MSMLVKYLTEALKAPREIHIESSSRCNANCIMCARAGMIRPQMDMPDEVFEKILAELFISDWKLDYVHMHLNGEPMMLPVRDLVSRINLLRTVCNKNIKTICMFTNGSLLTDEAIDYLLSSSLDLLQVSIDGGNKEDYEHVRKGLSWDTLLRNMQRLMQRRNETGSKLKVYTAIVPQKANEKSVKQYFDIFHEMGVDDAGGSGVNNLGGLIDSESMKLDTQTNEKAWGELPCWKLFLDLSIMADGRACLCAQDVQGLVVLGDVNHETLEQIWHGKVLKTWREEFIFGKRQSLDLCGRCDNMRGFVRPDWWDVPRTVWQEAYKQARWQVKYDSTD